MCVTARSRVNDEETPQSLPRGARMILKDYSDKEAVQSREWGLVSTSPPPFFFRRANVRVLLRGVDLG